MVVVNETRCEWTPLTETDLALIIHDLFYGPERLSVEIIAEETGQTETKVREILWQ